MKPLAAAESMDIAEVAPPRGERGLKLTAARIQRIAKYVAPPRGERGLKRLWMAVKSQRKKVAPPRGERGLKQKRQYALSHCRYRRSPSWGAWIETVLHNGICTKLKPVAPPRGERGLKQMIVKMMMLLIAVAPPRGERGLKHSLCQQRGIDPDVAPPRGERGLKRFETPPKINNVSSLPLVGSVD